MSNKLAAIITVSIAVKIATFRRFLFSKQDYKQNNEGEKDKYDNWYDYKKNSSEGEITIIILNYFFRWGSMEWSLFTVKMGCRTVR